MILLLLSFARTIVPAIVGAVTGFLAAQGLNVDAQLEGELTAVLMATFTGLYYLIVRVIEMKFPIVGVLLGWAKSPDSYSKGPGVDIIKPQGNTVEVTVNATDTTDVAPSDDLDRVKNGPDHKLIE